MYRRFKVSYFTPLCVMFLFVAFLGQLHSITSPETIKDKSIVQLHAHADSLSKFFDGELRNIKSRVDDLDQERKVWGTTLERSNVIFTAFISMILFVFGVLYNLLFNKRIKNVKAYTERSVSELLYRMERNELLQFRALYFTFCNLQLHMTAMLWGARYIDKLYKQGMTQQEDKRQLIDFIQNIIDLYNEELVNESLEEDPDMLSEVITLLMGISNYKVPEIDDNIKESLQAILSDLYGKASYVLSSKK